MQRFLTLLLILQVSLMVGAQFEVVSELVEQPNHLGLMQLDDIDRKDDNNELGALIIINCGIPDVYFENTISKISQSYRSGAYWVTLKKRARYFLIKKEGYPNFRYSFPNPLKGGTVYEMTVDEKNKLSETITLVISSNQEDASAYIQGELIGKTENKLLTIDLPLGDNEIELRKSGYKTKVVTHNLTPENNKLEINLEPALPSAVTITTEPEGATVYIDNVLFGSSPKSSFFNAGTYPIKIEKSSYATINESITITEPETTKHYKLKDIRATLTINTSENASIKLNNKIYQSVKNLKLPASVVEIEVSQPKAETIKQVITLKAEEKKTIDIYPNIQSGSISVVTIPTSASIELRGDAGEYYTAIGRKSFTDIPIGSYELIVTNDGYKSHKETIKTYR